MRGWLYSVLAMTSCYRPAHEASCTVSCADNVCPAGLDCVAGTCIAPGDVCDRDAAIDTQPDALVCPPPFSSETRLVPGFSYTTDGTHAIYESSGLIYETSVDTTDPGQPITTLGGTILSRPRMSPPGDELYVLDDNNPIFLISKSMKNVGGSWQAVIPVPFTGITFDASSAPGVPTTTMPRRMMIATQSALYEATENPGWKVETTYPSTSFGLQGLDDPALSPDGLRLVFIGDTLTGSSGIFVATRTSVMVPFTAASLLYQLTGVAAVTPAQGATCRDLYVSKTDDGHVWHIR